MSSCRMKITEISKTVKMSQKAIYAIKKRFKECGTVQIKKRSDRKRSVRTGSFSCQCSDQEKSNQDHWWHDKDLDSIRSFMRTLTSIDRVSTPVQIDTSVTKILLTSQTMSSLYLRPNIH
ncbi:unnamed protein product [Lepeophtheirus salmonis]|uniref:(salmon louse) hypothetical protein n=1 Tax=Lepeophtheirus salmonis TaxID=72036 RepID=A0A7R8CIB6_LEPSM|nr:unnamed protein product [Lepeophtheirus salmonis]CAF2830117.1 unnamed protein product [Lepeophtheirus salmonis]